MSSTRRASGAEPDPWRGDVGLGVSAWLGDSSDAAGAPPEWAGPLPETPFVPEEAAEELPQLGGRRPRRTSGDESRRREPRAGAGGDGGSGARRGRKPRLTPEEAVAAMTPLELEEYARKILLDQLTGQARSRKQLMDKLAAKCVPEELSVRLLDRFEEVGLVDDEAFARMWIASRQPGKGLAGRALAQELRRKGIDDEVVKEAVAEIDPDDERAAAERLVQRKMRSVASLDRQVATRRLVGMLARKGYGAGLAYSVVREALDAHAAEELDDLEA